MSVIHHLQVDLLCEDETWRNYFDSANDSVIASREPRNWCIRTRYFGRGTRNLPDGVCFRNTFGVPPYESTRPFVTLRVTLDGVRHHPVQIPLEAARIRDVFPEPVMELRIPVSTGPLEITGISLRDIRSTEDHEMSAMHFIH